MSRLIQRSLLTFDCLFVGFQAAVGDAEVLRSRNDGQKRSALQEQHHTMFSKRSVEGTRRWHDPPKYAMRGGA